MSSNRPTSQKSQEGRRSLFGAGMAISSYRRGDFLNSIAKTGRFTQQGPLPAALFLALARLGRTILLVQDTVLEVQHPIHVRNDPRVVRHDEDGSPFVVGG